MPGVQPIDFGRRALEDHAAVVGEAELARLRSLAEPLAGARVLHLSAPGHGGRVPELLGSLLPLLCDLGVQAEWRVLFGEGAFAEVARALHDGLQGAEIALADGAWERYLEACESAAESLEPGFDAVVVHGPELLGLAAADERDAGRRIVWRCHVDASEPDGEAWELALPLVSRYELLVFAAEGFAPPDAPDPPGGTHAIAPAIDPLSPKHHELPPGMAGSTLRSLGLDLSRPFCCQVGRFDRWKDPHAAIDAFAVAKVDVPELQLVLAGTLPGESPDDWRLVKEISDYAGDEPDLHVLTSYSGVGNIELNAVQRVARVALQHSVREGFGLAASEALWKGTPVVAAAAGGIPLQVRDGTDGYLAADAEQSAARVVELVRDPGLAIEMGAAGRERVRERFLVTRLLADELELISSFASSGAATLEG